MAAPADSSLSLLSQVTVLTGNSWAPSRCLQLLLRFPDNRPSLRKGEGVLREAGRRGSVGGWGGGYQQVYSRTTALGSQTRLRPCQDWDSELKSVLPIHKTSGVVHKLRKKKFTQGFLGFVLNKFCIFKYQTCAVTEI